MISYYLIPNSACIQRSDGAVIPPDPLNLDYVAYQTWLQAGNVATNPAESSSQLWAAFQMEAQAELDKTDTTMHRIAEAVALGTNTAGGADVVAFVQYRRALRAIVATANGTPSILPVRPPYPVGT